MTGPCRSSNWVSRLGKPICPGILLGYVCLAYSDSPGQCSSRASLGTVPFLSESSSVQYFAICTGGLFPLLCTFRDVAAVACSPAVPDDPVFAPASRCTPSVSFLGGHPGLSILEFCSRLCCSRHRNSSLRHGLSLGARLPGTGDPIQPVSLSGLLQVLSSDSSTIMHCSCCLPGTFACISFLSGGSVGAQNMCIGGSGTQAPHPLLQLPSSDPTHCSASTSDAPFRAGSLIHFSCASDSYLSARLPEVLSSNPPTGPAPASANFSRLGAVLSFACSTVIESSLLSGGVFASAHNMCIGCSGTQASQNSIILWDLGARLPEIPQSFCSSGAPVVSQPVLLPIPRPGGLVMLAPGFIPSVTPARAHNMCIGGSGTQASLPLFHLTCWVDADFAFDRTLAYTAFLQELLRAFFCTLALLVLWLLASLLGRPMRARLRPFGVPVGASAPSTLIWATVAFGFTRPHHATLDWSPWRNRKGKVPKGSGSYQSLTRRFCLWALLLLSIPEPVSAVPLLKATWLLTAPAWAMTRAPQPGDPPGAPYTQRRPHLIPPEELTPHVGTCPHTLVNSLRRDLDGDEPRLLPLDAATLPSADDSNPDSGSEWLGAYLLAPHYKTLTLAIRPPEHSMRSALDLLLDRSPDIPGAFFDTVLPLRPQRFGGIGSFVRFSSTVRNTGVGGQAVVVLDLTRVGGQYFAAVLAKELAYQTLIDYIVPLTSCHDVALSVFIGYRTRRWPESALVTLRDGDVITVLRQEYEASPPIRAEDLFNTGTKWRFPRDIPRFTYGESLCVLHRDRRYLLPEHHHYGMTSVAYIAEKLRLDPHKTVMCSFPTPDLEVQGELATSLVAVAEVPSPANTGVSRDAACDLFVLLDPRPYGLKPQFLFLHHNVVHIPTIIALLGLSTSPATRVGVSGGDVRGDKVHVQGNTTLLLFPELRPFDESEADSSTSTPTRRASLWDESEPPASAAQEDDWGEPRGPTFEGVMVVDPSLPPGQGWNEGVEAEPPAVLTDTTTPLRDVGAAPDDASATSSPRPALAAPQEAVSPPSATGLFAAVRIQALVYAPDFVPEVVDLNIEVPQALPAFLESLQAARLAYQSASFPVLFPATPQPASAFAILVAGPMWQQFTTVVLFDCLDYDGTLFAKSVHQRLSRESLLLAAGIPPDAAVHVYLRGSLHHLHLDQRVALENGDTIQIIRRGSLLGECSSLEDKLASTDQWDPHAALPGPRSHFNGCFQMLSEGQPFPFRIAPGGHSSFKRDIAQVLGSQEHRLTLKTSVPRIVDAFPFGHWATGVIVATEALSRVPFPPARALESRHILILDQRRILRGFAWRLVSNQIVFVQAIIDLYADLCPYRHTVLVHGAPTDQRDGQPVFLIQHGQVLVVEFRPVTDSGDVPASPWSDHAQHVPGTQQSDPGNDAPAGSGSGPPPAADSTGGARTRSRTPRQHALSHTSKPVACASFRADSSCPAIKWSLDLLQHAHPVGHPDLTPDFWKLPCPAFICNTAHAFAWLAANPSRLWDGTADLAVFQPCPSLQFSLWGIDAMPRSCKQTPGCYTTKLLQDPATADATDTAINAARTATRLLGEEWPMPPFRWPDEPAQDVDLEPHFLTEGESLIIDIVVCLLTPDYTPEQLDLTVELPQTVPDLVDLVQLCRDKDRSSLFPALVEVIPQPDPGWGLLLATPAWVHNQAILCFDLSLFDGRIFAVAAPFLADCQLLLALAGLAPTAEVEIYVPGAQEALLQGVDCVLHSGMCLTFVRAGRGRPATFRLALLSPRMGA